MFTVKIGPITTDVESELLEDTAGKTDDLVVLVELLQDSVNRVYDVVAGTPHIVFQIGPVTEQKEKFNG